MSGYLDPYEIAWFAFINLLTYFYVSLCLYKIAGDFGRKDRWRAWIPIANEIWYLCIVADAPLYYMILIILPVIGLIPMFYMWYRIAIKKGISRRIGLSMIISNATILLIPIALLIRRPYIGLLFADYILADAGWLAMLGLFIAWLHPLYITLYPFRNIGRYPVNPE